jgi:biotin synthase
MKADSRILQILGRTQEGLAPSRNDCVALLECSSTSLEASLTRSIADAICRKRFGNQGFIFGQIGIENSRCPADCKFCGFSESHSLFEPSKMTAEAIMDRAINFTDSGDLSALFLMTMHAFDLDRVSSIARALRQQLPELQIVVNIGDFDREQAVSLKNAGVNGAYHICRLREGIDTGLSPDARKKTLAAIKDAGLDLYYCCEPIGPEHSAKELVEQLFIGIEFGCLQHAAMRRACLPHTPLAPKGQITELRLAQITAVVTLASIECPETKCIAVHEPNLIGLTSGANAIYAETGVNPRDTAQETSLSRGRDVPACKTMLYEAGFDSIA